MKKKSGAEPNKPEDAEAQLFTLDEHRSDSMRAAMDDQQDGALTDFWARMGDEMGFYASSVVLVTTPEAGPVTFRAVPAPADASKNPEPEPGPAEEDESAAPQGVDFEARQALVLERMEDASIDMPIEAATLAGDLTDAMLEMIKQMDRPYRQLTQPEKRDFVEGLKLCSVNLVQGAVDAVASDGRTTITAFVESVAAGAKTKIVLTMGAMGEDAAADAIGDLYRLLKKQVQIVTSDASHHMGKRREHVPEDQEALPFDRGQDPPAAAPEAAEPIEPGDAREDELDEDETSDIDGDALESQGDDDQQ